MDNAVLQDEIDAAKEMLNEPSNGIRDDAYWERRRKNNEAAKRSRDARRVKEDEIAIRFVSIALHEPHSDNALVIFRAAILEQENMKLRLELSQLKQETAKLRCMIHAGS